MNELPVTEAMDRRNGLVYTLGYAFIFLAAPVTYVDVVPATLCNRLGANATVANLPAATYLMGGIAPLFLSMTVPHRLEHAIVVYANGLTAVFLGLVFLALVLPFPHWVPLLVVVGHGFFQGIAYSTATVFTLQCLARGTTQAGRNRMLQKTFFLAPVCAVIGSLAAQYVLGGHIRQLKFPYDFASLYAFGSLCLLAVTASSSFYQLTPVADEKRPPLFPALVASSREYLQSTPLVLLFGVYLFGSSAIAVSPTLSLYTSHAVDTTRVNFSGLLMALRFGGKSLGGYLLGMVAIRWGLNASVTASLTLLLCAILWGWLIPGYAFLFAFGLIGAGELSAAYIPNYGIAFSRRQTTARNLSLLMMASPLAGISPALYGFLADRWGFNASFAFALGVALAALGLIRCLRKQSIVAKSGRHPDEWTEVPA